MEKLKLNYELNSTTVSNPDGSFLADVVQCTLVPGPGTIPAGTFSKALHFEAGSSIQSPVSQNLIPSQRFCVQMVFKAGDNITTRQNLAECPAIPFSIFLEAGATPSTFNAVVSVGNSRNDLSSAGTFDRVSLNVGHWYLVDLVFDTDTLAVLIDGEVIAVNAIPKGALMPATADQLFIGTDIDRSTWQFKGDIALFRLYEEIPAALEAIVNACRNTPEWQISYKRNEIHSQVMFDKKVGDIVFDPSIGSFVQNYTSGLIMFTDSIGTAFEMHGNIWSLYQTVANRAALGNLVSNEINAGKAGSRKSLFSKGGIYWSALTGAVIVTGQIYLDYESMSESRSAIGLPLKNANVISGGWMQEFEFGQMYLRNLSSKAFELHGQLLAKYLQLDGMIHFGFPVGNESIIYNERNINVGKSVELERATIYWSAATGAHVVYGSIREEYTKIKGPLSALGFPTSDEANIPNAAGFARYNTFTNGSILWLNGKPYICGPFNIYVGIINTKESESWLRGQNDLYIYVRLLENGREICKVRKPESGYYNENNIEDLQLSMPLTIIPNTPAKNIELNIDVWEYDPHDDDDHLGTYSKILNIANAWELSDHGGIVSSGAFSGINNIEWSIKPEVPPGTPKDFWETPPKNNPPTPEISYAQYATAFCDVDSEPEWWDVTDWIDQLYYYLVVKGIASSGNCFGESLESIYAWKSKSRFSVPLKRFTDFGTIKNDINIKHTYQLGADPVWWFVKQFLTGRTHDPVSVFNLSRQAFLSGCDPVINLTSDYAFQNDGHCVRPIAWDSTVSPWKITILDPNRGNEYQTLRVDPATNSFTYLDIYKGSAWTGGRMHFMPFDILNSRQRNPLWDAIQLILAGTIILCGDNTETESITDLAGNDLNGFHDVSGNNINLQNKFVPYYGFHGDALPTKGPKPAPIALGSTKGITAKSSIRAEMFFRTPHAEIVQERIIFGPSGVKSAAVYNKTLAEIAKLTSHAVALDTIVKDGHALAKLKNATFKELSNYNSLLRITGDKLISETIMANSGSFLGPVQQNFIHSIRGKADGQLSYILKNSLTAFKLESTIKKQETNSLTFTGTGTGNSLVTVRSTTSKLFDFEYSSKLGIGGDRIKITVKNIPAMKNSDIKINARPGINGIDLLTSGGKTNAIIEIEASVQGTIKKQTFNTAIEGGIRILPGMMLHDNQIKVGRIDTIFGDMINPQVIKPKI